MIESQGFTEEQARSVDHSTLSGYAAPLLSADGGVVGIARFIERKYTV